MIREPASGGAVSWDEAIAATSPPRSGASSTAHGPDAVGVLGSARATNEDNYLVQKLARAVLGTNNVDCCARVCHAPSAVGAAPRCSAPAQPRTRSTTSSAPRRSCVCGTNTTENHPIVGARIKQAALRGARLIVIDPRRIELAEYADVHLRPRPGTNVLVLNAIAAAIVDEGLVDEAFLGERVDGLDDFRVASSEPSARSGSPDECGVRAGRHPGRGPPLRHGQARHLASTGSA